MTKLVIPEYIGKCPNHADDFYLRDDAVTETFAILAMRGSGKSVLAGVMQEIFVSRGEQIIVIDPPGAHTGIRNAANEKNEPIGPSGLNVLIIGGKNSDIEFNPQGGAELAQVLMDTKMSCVIDLKRVRPRERKDFLTEFGEELLAENTSPLHIFMEEADEIVPQQPDNREEQAIRHVWRKIAKSGRQSGLGFTAITQRPAMVDKTTLSQIDNLFLMNLMGFGDVKVIREWTKLHSKDPGLLKDMIDSLPHLQPGEAYLVSPKWLQTIVRLNVRRRVTYHAGRTPKRGENVVQPQKYEIGEVTSRLKAKLAEKAALIESEAEERSALVRRVQDLESEIERVRATPTCDVNHEELKFDSFRQGDQEGYGRGRRDGDLEAQNREQIGFARGKQEGYMLGTEVARKFLLDYVNTMQPPPLVVKDGEIQTPPIPEPFQRFNEIQREVVADPVAHMESKTGERVAADVEFAGHRVVMTPSRTGFYAPQPHPAPSSPPAAPVAPAIGKIPDLSSGKLHSRVLSVLARFEGMGRHKVRRSVVSALARARGGYYERVVGELKTSGLIDYPDAGWLALTTLGKAKAPKATSPITQNEMYNQCLGALKGLQRRIFDLVYREGEMSREKVSERVGARGGYFERVVGELKSMEFICYPAPGKVRVSDWVWIDHRRMA